MDNDRFLEYIREDMKNMENRLADRITKVEGKIECLRKDIVQIYQDIFEMQKEVQDVNEKLKSKELDDEELKILKIKVDNMINNIEELKVKCDREDISVKKVTTICATISASLSVIASIITNKL